MRWSIPELIRNMRDEAKFLTSDGKRKEDKMRMVYQRENEK